VPCILCSDLVVNMGRTLEHEVQRKTTLKRAEEQRVNELKRYGDQTRWLSSCAEKLTTVDQVREANLKARQAAEEEQRRLLKEKQETRQREIATKELDKRIIMEIHKQKTEQTKNELEIQRVLDNSVELKELEQKLKTAYVNKERAAQHQEKLLLQKLEHDREQAIEIQMDHDRQLDIERQGEKEMGRRRMLTAQKEVLQKQMLEREEEKKRLLEETARDNKMIDDIITKINKEDEMERAMKMKKVEETRAAVAQFQNERRLQQEAAEKEQQQQEAEILAHNKMMEQRHTMAEEAKKRVEEAKKLQWEKVVETTSNLTQTKEEFETLRNMLWEEELSAKQKREEQEEIERQMQLKEEMMRENKAQIAAKKEMLEKMELEEKELVERMLQKFAMDEEDEKKQEENRRLFKQRYMAEATQQRLERGAMLQQEKEREAKELEAFKKREEQRRRIIDEAKRVLLQKHANQLAGFLEPLLPGKQQQLSKGGL
jgi:hypothetical protein